MLVLRRKAGESIILNQVITIRILGIGTEGVKLGIDAPPDVIIQREELYLAQQLQQLPVTVIVHGGTHATDE